MATIIIQRQDGIEYDLDALGFRVKSFSVPLNNNSYGYQQVGKYGSTMTTFASQYLVIPLTIVITAADMADYNLQLLELRRIFRSDEDFYVINAVTPFMRWKVRAEAVTPTQQSNFWQSADVAINLDCADGYAESVATTLDWNVEEWGFGLNVPKDEISYEFAQNDFSFWNLGMIPLLADERPAKIIFQGNAPNGFTIINNTTQQSIQIKRGVSSSDKVIIDGVMPLINGQQAYNDCDHGYLDFVTGENKLHVDGASDFSLRFETRFYY